MEGRSKSIILGVITVMCVMAATPLTSGKERGGPQAPMLSLENPIMNSGAAYTMTVNGKTMDISYAIVGKEDVKGDSGTWMETRMQSAELGGETVTKMLMVTTGSEPGMKRMITQAPGHDPMEMSGMMMGMMKSHQPQQTSDKPDRGELVGTESVTVPAGTFTCQHYRKQEKSGPVDYWIAPQVASFSVVKMTSGQVNMVLTKILSNENSHITGEPKKMPGFEMPHF